MLARLRGQVMARPTKKQLEVVRTNYVGGEVERPKTRSDCASVPRPCPFVSCKHHVYLDVRPDGSVKLNFPTLEVDELTVSCALDVADGGEHGFDYIGAALGISKSRAEQIHQRALEKCLDVRVLKEFRP